MTTDKQRIAEQSFSKNGQPFLVCPKCWHTEAFWQVHTRGEDTCPKCSLGQMVTIEPLQAPAPAVGTALLCMVCAFFKPWNLFDGSTCAAICEECMAKFRAHSEQGWVSVSERLPGMGKPVTWWSGQHQEINSLVEAPEEFQPEITREYATEFFTHWRENAAPPVHPESAQEVK